MPNRFLPSTGKGPNTTRSYLARLAMVTSLCFAGTLGAQEDLDEVIVVGSQISGASIADILPVSVFSNEDIEALGIESGDELLDNLPEMGQNQFSEASETGGINSSRGDIGAYNLRNLGVGSTLALINGRRLVNSPGYQTEIIGGGYTPVSTVNSNLIPAQSLARVEVLRDGASALYGADALAGVVNNVTNKDYQGFSIRARHKHYQQDERTNDAAMSMKFGSAFNQDKSHITVSYEFLEKGRMRAADNARWSVADLSTLVPEDSAYRQSEYWGSTGSEFFDNTSGQPALGQFDMLESASRIDSSVRDYVDGSGEFQVLRLDDPRCAASESGVTDVYDTGYGTCIVSDSTTNSLERSNSNRQRWVRGESERHNLFITFTHDVNDSLSLYNEISYYKSSYYTERNAASQYPFKFHISAAAYYNPLRTSTSLASDFDPDAELWIDNYRFSELPRTANIEKTTFRFLQGITGSFQNWDYDGALLYSKAESTDEQNNSISRQLMQEALFDTTSAGYNFLCDPTDPAVPCTTNIDRTVVSVEKNGLSELSLIDFKISTEELFTLPAGPVAFLAGFEYREEVLEDNRSDLLNGTETFTHLINASTAVQSASGCFLGDSVTGAMLDASSINPNCMPINVQYPFLTGIAGGTPSADFRASRETTSLFTEFTGALSETVSAQVALRYEDTSTSGSEVVWKLALGWDVTEDLLLRASTQTSFRAPDLVALSQPFAHRINSGQNDYSRAIGEDDARRVDDWLYRRAVNNPTLQAETAENISFGFVYEPNDELTITADLYRISKDNTIGNLGSTNEAALDFLMRARDADARGYAALTEDTFAAVCGTAASGSVLDADGTITSVSTQHNIRVVRPAVTNEPGAEDGWDDLSSTAQDKGFCPAGGEDWFFAQSAYENMAERTIEGFDIGIYYNWDTDIGAFSARYNGAFTTELEQRAKPGTDAETLIQARDSGEFEAYVTEFTPDETPITQVNLLGWGSLLGSDGFFEEKHSARLSWRQDDWSAAVTMRHVGEFNQSALTLPDGTEWTLDSMTTFNVTAAYRFDINDTRFKVTLGSTNITDERAPLADDTYGFNPDVHNDYGRSVYIDVKADF